MRSAGSHDVFIVLNGPQDGTEYPIGASAVQIGQDASCAVKLSLDQSVQPVHAIATAVGKGYSIRSHTHAPVFVGGKKVTRLRSRVLGSGDTLQVGHTELMLECSPDGMSGRSVGIALPTDFSWAAKNIVRALYRIGMQLVRLGMLVPRYAWRHKFLTVVVILIASRFIPGLGQIVDQVIGEIKAVITSFVAELRR